MRRVAGRFFSGTVVDLENLEAIPLRSEKEPNMGSVTKARRQRDEKERLRQKQSLLASAVQARSGERCFVLLEDRPNAGHASPRCRHAELHAAVAKLTQCAEVTQKREPIHTLLSPQPGAEPA